MSRVGADTAGLAPRDSPVLARQRHYGAFYGFDPLPRGFGLVVGNCQAESLRVVLDAEDRATVRIPPVHEMTDSDARRLHELVAEADFVVMQPIRDDYRGLPLGTAQLTASARPGSRLVTVPSIRFAGLQPFQSAMRVPGVDEDPPLVPYHDVRTVADAAGLPVRDELDGAAVARIAADSIDELRRRETGIDVAVSDLLRTPTADTMRTVNHPGNAIWMPLGARVLEALGARGEPTDPGRPLLAAIRAPLPDWVVTAWDLTDEPRAHWLVEGAELDDAAVREAQREWYRAHPEFVRAAVERLAPLLALWRRG